MGDSVLQTEIELSCTLGAEEKPRSRVNERRGITGKYEFPAMTRVPDSPARRIGGAE